MVIRRFRKIPAPISPNPIPAIVSFSPPSEKPSRPPLLLCHNLHIINHSQRWQSARACRRCCLLLLLLLPPASCYLVLLPWPPQHSPSPPSRPSRRWCRIGVTFLRPDRRGRVVSLPNLASDRSCSPPFRRRRRRRRRRQVSKMCSLFTSLCAGMLLIGRGGQV